MAEWLNADLMIPENDAPNREFFEQQGGGQLKLPKCNDCDMMHYPPRTMCPGLPRHGHLLPGGLRQGHNPLVLHPLGADSPRVSTRTRTPRLR